MSKTDNHMKRQDFTCNDTGFHMKFTNGNTVSVQWNENNYGNGSTEAEVAAWDKSDRWHRFEPNGDTVKGWLSADEVAEFIQCVASNELSIGEEEK